MDNLLVFMTPLRNDTQLPISFRANSNECHRLPVLPPGETRLVKQTRILKWISLHDHPETLKIWVLLDNHFTGITLNPGVLLSNILVVFRFGDDGLGVFVTKEKASRGDFLLRLKCFGCKRDGAWRRRSTDELIAESDDVFARKLRGRKGMIWPSDSMRFLNFRTTQENVVDHGRAGDHDEPLPATPAHETTQENAVNPSGGRQGDHDEPSSVPAAAAAARSRTKRKKAEGQREGNPNNRIVHYVALCVALILVWSLPKLLNSSVSYIF